jgi:hypothetical protein
MRQSFADSATGFFIFGGNVKITFESVRVDHTTSPGPLNRVVIGRLVMPIDGAEALAKGLLDFIAQQRAQATAQAQSPASTRH